MRVLTASDMRLITAKSQLLKAIDFTIGLFKRLQKTHPEWGFFGVVLPQLIEFRQSVQTRKITYSGQTMSRSLQRAYQVGQKMLNELETDESHLLIDPSDLKAFFASIPNSERQAVLDQSAWMEAMIAREKAVPVSEVPELVMGDKNFFGDAYDIILPFIQGAQAALKNVPVGDILSRVKDPKSTFGKQARKKKPFTRLTDLVGSMILADDIREMGKATSVVQRQFDVLNKENYFLDPGTYYGAVNYTVLGGRVIGEVQVKTDLNYASQMVSHDLIYAPEKAIAHLSPDERKLVEIVCGAIKTMSVDEILSTIQA
jgi:hypothetical protein